MAIPKWPFPPRVKNGSPPINVTVASTPSKVGEGRARHLELFCLQREKLNVKTVYQQRAGTLAVMQRMP